MNNFRCKECNTEMFIGKYIISVKNGVCIYNIQNEAIKCTNCKSENIEYINHKAGFCTNFARYSAMTPEQKKLVIKKRAAQHTKKNIEHIKNIDRNYTGQNIQKIL